MIVCVSLLLMYENAERRIQSIAVPYFPIPARTCGTVTLRKAVHSLYCLHPDSKQRETDAQIVFVWHDTLPTFHTQMRNSSYLRRGQLILSAKNMTAMSNLIIWRPQIISKDIVPLNGLSADGGHYLPTLQNYLFTTIRAKFQHLNDGYDLSPFRPKVI